MIVMLKCATLLVEQRMLLPGLKVNDLSQKAGYQKMRSLFIFQLVLVLVGMAVAFFYLQEPGLLSAAFGGGVAIMNSVMLSRRLKSAAGMAENNPDAGVLSLYFGVVQRFIFTLVMFGVGMGLLKLAPPPMLGVFALAQLGYVLYGRNKLTEEVGKRE